MTRVRNIQQSMIGGEMSPEIISLFENAKVRAGLQVCRNFEILPQGVAQNRAGFRFVRAAKYADKRCRLLPFSFSTTQTMVIEMGDQYFRFHTNGGTLLAGSPPAYSGATPYAVGNLVSSGGTNYYCIAPTTGNAPPNATYWYPLPASGEYEIPSPYLEADLFDVHYVQSADVFTLVHQGYAPRELRRLGATNWQLSAISFAPTLAAPTGVTATEYIPASADVDADTYTNVNYLVTALASDNVSESAPSAVATASTNLYVTGASVSLAWDAVLFASRYNVYKETGGGLYGYIGQTDQLSMTDDNIAPDVSKTPPIYDTVFQSGMNYPGAVSYFEQRRCFAGTLNDPQTIWMTKSGTESLMSYSLPTLDDDRIKFRVAAREANTIRHIVPLAELLLLTSSAEWRVTSVNSDVLTPTTVSVKSQSYIGASNVQPVIINNALIFAAARGGHVRECAYSWQGNGFITGDLSLYASHLFDGFDIIDAAYSKAPYSMVWFVSSAGNLLGLTYVPEQQIGAWHRHDTDGVFESCAVVAEGAEDHLYTVVQREIDGGVVRYIERKESRAFDELADAFIVDCGLTYSGSPATTISGLDHLEGKEVAILGDGAVFPRQSVSGGQIVLDHAVSLAHIGLPIEADLQKLPLAMALQDGSFAQGHTKNINKIWMRVHRSSGIFAGPDADNLVQYKQRNTEPYGTPPRLQTDEIEIVTTPQWGSGAQAFVRQSDPLPVTVLSMTLEVAMGG